MGSGVSVGLSLGMLSHARQRGVAKVALMHAERLAFEDGEFDTVVSILGTCTFPDPVQALREMRRVCRLEHGHSDWPTIAKWQDRRAPKHAGFPGCWWNREPLENVRKAGLEPVVAACGLFGMIHVIEAVA
jgi:SAM-dependent methyltransferase